MLSHEMAAMLLYKTATKSQFLRNISILSKYNDFVIRVAHITWYSYQGIDFGSEIFYCWASTSKIFEQFKAMFKAPCFQNCSFVKCL